MGDGCNLVEWWNRETRFAIVALDGFLVVAVLVYHSYSLFIFCSLVGAVHCQDSLQLRVLRARIARGTSRKRVYLVRETRYSVYSNKFQGALIISGAK